MLFSELESPAHSFFGVKHRIVTKHAVLFGRALEKVRSDWLRPQTERGGIEVFEKCGAVVARNVLSVDITAQIFDELLASGAKLHDIKGVSASGLGRAYGSGITDFMIKMGHTSAAEGLLAEVFTVATNEQPHFLIREYGIGANGQDGYQDPHTDSATIFPTIIFGTGPGFTRIVNANTGWYPDGAGAAGDTMLEFIHDETTDLVVGSFDIGVFEGIRHLHAGMRASVLAENDDPRRVVAVNASSFYAS